ncbi:hypothetical protein [Shewanella sp. GXUN23E]|uniref:hypothetical protein n=1 Tax=Shewanella sp. GXUN23E TaxID=3422498 RepID=UPI003D7C638C
MINGVSDALRLAGQLAPVSQTVKSSLSGTDKPSANAQASVGQFRATAFERWAQMTQAQHRVSSAQLAIQAQNSLLGSLKQMLSLIPQAMKQPQAQARLEQLRSQLCSNRPCYLGLPLLDHQFSLRLNPARPQRRRFRLRSVSLTTPKARDEQLMWQLPTADGPVVLSLQLPANAQAQELAALLNMALAPHGIGIEGSEDGRETLLECDEALWPLLKDGLQLKGQGYRLPAGESRQIKVQEILHWQDPREWDLSSAAGLKQTEIKLQKVYRKLSEQIRQTQAQLQHLGTVLHTQPAAPEAELLQTVSTQFAQSPFAGQLKALLAQANLGRQQAKELLNNQ